MMHLSTVNQREVLEAAARLLDIRMVTTESEFHEHASRAIASLVCGPWTACERYEFKPQSDTSEKVIWKSGSVVDEVTDELYAVFKPLVSEHKFFEEAQEQAANGVIDMNAFAKRDKNFRDTGLYQDFYRKLNITDQLSLSLHLGPNSALLFTFSRDRPFTATESAKLNAILPYCQAAWQNWLAASHGPYQPLDIETLQHAHGLPLRRAQVLRCIALGQSNADIARALNLRVATVRKHVQLLFQDLGVKSRIEASVLAWRGRGPCA